MKTLSLVRRGAWKLALAFTLVLSAVSARADYPQVVPWNYFAHQNYTEPGCQPGFAWDVFTLFGAEWGGFRISHITLDEFPELSDYEEWSWNAGGWPVTVNAEYWRERLVDGELDFYCAGGGCGADVSPLSFPFQYASVVLTDGCGVVDAYGYTDTAFFPTNGPTNFVKCHYTIFPQVAAPTLVGTDISTPLGTCDTNREVYWYGSTVWGLDCTPTLPAAFSNYIFTVSAQTARLRIYRGANDITDSNVTVIVGEQIALTCAFDDGTIAPITNFSWTVPGNVVSGFTNSQNYGEGLALTNKSNSSVLFYWVEGGSTFDVVCSAIVKGISVQARCTFVVTAAVGTLNAAFQTNVVVAPAFPRVQLGNDGNPPGIVFTGTGTTPGNWEFCQIMLSSEVRANVATNVTGGNLVSLLRSLTNALDGSYPYGTIQILGNNHATIDSPKEPTGDTVKHWRDDSFTMFFMFQPTNVGASIPVPVRKVSWSWGAFVTNATALASSHANIASQNQPATVHPSWRTNTVPTPAWQSNPSHYP